MSLNLRSKETGRRRRLCCGKYCSAAVVAEYRGMTVEQMKVLRRDAHDNNVLCKSGEEHTITSCSEGTDFACLDELLVGPLAFAASEDPVAVAKILDKYAKQYEL